jgi:polyhydroxybutyrate depolymerase
MNQDGEQFWDAGWCCNWDHQPVDDVAYLISLVDEMATQYNVDPGRVYAMGHSNGGFMAYRLACDAGDRFTAIMSLAGAQFKDPIECTPTHSVGVLQVHGTEDKNVPYEGGNHYLSAWDSANYWAAHNGCGDPVEGTIMNLDAELEGPETVPTEWNGCPGSLRVALWSMEGIAHTPGIYNGTFAQLAVKFLLSQSKP